MIIVGFSGLLYRTRLLFLCELRDLRVHGVGLLRLLLLDGARLDRSWREPYGTQTQDDEKDCCKTIKEA